MRPPYTTLLCPTDLSDAGDAAVPIACSLAAPGAVVHLLHVDVPPLLPSPLDLPPVPAGPPPASEWEATVARVRQHLERLVPADARARGVRVELHVESDPDPAGALLRAAGEVGAQALVLGTHGRTGFARLLIGSVASAVLKRATLPVVLVRPPR